MCMITINQVTTKTGDFGQTLGAGCEKTSKYSIDIEFLGKLDEVNCNIGFVILNTTDKNDLELLNLIQNQIFDLGSFFYKQEILDFSIWILKLEQEIERYNKSLPTLKSFLLPQGNTQTMYLHLARTGARNVERVFWSYYDNGNNKNIKNIELIGKYLNRLSDYFFTLLRRDSKILWEQEII